MAASLEKECPAPRRTQAELPAFLRQRRCAFMPYRRKLPEIFTGAEPGALYARTDELEHAGMQTTEIAEVLNKPAASSIVTR